ncbi:MAG: hypothetical protein MPN21_09605 [Thermoanaerobaculia bacterium]|nr:hypothetical protein [Thermoanaerobaculia bacterium]
MARARARVDQLELWQRLNVVGAVFCVWLGIVLALGAAAVPLNGLWATSRAIILPAVVPGLALGAYWLWKASKLQAASFFRTVADTDNGLVEMFRGRARTVSFYTTIMGLIVLVAGAANYDAVKDFGGLFHLFALASLLFASYGVAYLYLHVSSR